MNISTKGLLAVLLLSLIGSVRLAQAQTKKPLVLEIDQLRNTTGQICYGLYNKADGFPDDKTKVVKGGCVPIQSLPLEISLDQLPYGLYAVSLLHDEDSNNQLKTGLFGIPQEGFGFSNNPVVRTKAPTFQQSSFVFSPSQNRFQISMIYF